MRLRPKPEVISACIVALERMDKAVHTVMGTIQLSLPVAVLELVDAATAAVFNLYAGTKVAEKLHLLFELHGSGLCATMPITLFQTPAPVHALS